MPTVNLKLYSFPQGGNRKSVKIVDKGELNWINALEEEVFSKDWLKPPTILLSLDLNFFNLRSGIMMDTKLVVAATGAGMYSLEIDTNRFTSFFGHSTTGHFMTVALGLILAIVLMGITFRYIKAERKVARILAATTDKEAAEGEGEAAKAADVAKDAEDEDEGEDDFSS